MTGRPGRDAGERVVSTATGRGEGDRAAAPPAVPSPGAWLTALGPGREFDQIRGIWRRLGARGDSGGDDCALVEVGGATLAISIDLHVEDVHFRRGWLRHDEIGWRAAAAALSDLAAVAAQPEGVLVSLGVPGEWPDEFSADIVDGVGAAADSVGAVVWGGDLVRSDRVIVDVCVVGSVTHPVRRSGARVGDALCVTGRLGGPAVALAALQAGREPPAWARERFAAPHPRVREAQWLRDRGATALIDISDGLIGDAGHLAAASQVAVVIEEEAVPPVPALASPSPPSPALTSGEEFELLLTMPEAEARAALADFAQTFGLPLTRIGRIESGQAVRLLRHGQPVDLPRGFLHF